VVYWDGQVLVRHIKTVTKLSPLKTVLVCKLELIAGLMGAHFAKFVQIALKMDGLFFWADSLTVHTTRSTSAIRLEKSRLSLSRMNDVLFLAA
jgi:hypothetical protein